MIATYLKFSDKKKWRINLLLALFAFGLLYCLAVLMPVEGVSSFRLALFMFLAVEVFYFVLAFIVPYFIFWGLDSFSSQSWWVLHPMEFEPTYKSWLDFTPHLYLILHVALFVTQGISLIVQLLVMFLAS